MLISNPLYSRPSRMTGYIYREDHARLFSVKEIGCPWCEADRVHLSLKEIDGTYTWVPGMPILRFGSG